MGKPIRITQAIENDSKFGEEGFVDKIDEQIRNYTGELTAIIDSPGGDVFKAALLSRSITEHQGNTKAIVNGMAASASSLLLADFDFVEADIDARFMFHSAHVPDTDTRDLTPEQQNEIKIFNQKAKRKIIQKMKSKGINNEALVDKIFNDPKGSDYWFSAKEARDLLGVVDEVTVVKRSEGTPSIIKIAASLKQNAKTKYESYKLKQMGIFSKKKPIVARVEMLKDDRIILFDSASDAIAKGDILTLVGSNESLKGSLILASGMKLIVNEDNTVESVEEAGIENEITPDVQAMFDEMIEAISAVIARVEALEGGGKETSEEEVAAVVEDTVVDVEEEKEEDEVEATKAELTVMQNKMKAITTALKEKTLVTNFQLPKADNKGEQQMTMKLSASAERSIAMREAINNKQKTA